MTERNPISATSASPSAPKPLKSSLRRLAIGEEVHGRFVEERRLTGRYGEFVAIVLAADDGPLVSCAHRALHNTLRKLKPAVGDYVAIRRLPDGVSKRTGHAFADYAVRVAPADRDGLDR
jgi:hypothetical protein